MNNSYTGYCPTCKCFPPNQECGECGRYAAGEEIGIMSNEYKEWEKDRQEEAFNDIHKIAEIFEEWRENGAGEGITNGWFAIRDILEEGGWI